MTIESLIKDVAIIGAGPSGIAAVYELTHTLQDGTSIFGVKDISPYKDQLAFKTVVAFERNSSVGGIWGKAVAEKAIDPSLPRLESLAEDIDYSKPENIYLKSKIPENLNDSNDYQNPVLIKRKINDTSDKYQWSGSGIYKGLFTNVSKKYMSYSFDEYDLNSIKNRPLKELLAAGEVGDYLEESVKKNNLGEYIKLNSNVEYTEKIENKWHVTIQERIFDAENGTVIEKWYKQKFDGLIIANGKTIPYYPKIPSFKQFIEKNPNVVIQHSKSIYDPEILVNQKKLLFIGGNVSAVDLVQYCFPRPLDPPTIFVSKKQEGDKKFWIEKCLNSGGIVNKTVIKRFLPDINGVEFEDGSIETDFDYIVFATGYHVYYPFLETKNYLKKYPRALDFFLFTFSVDDPTLTLVGNTYAAFFFNRNEAIATAIAGVWSGYTKVASREEEDKWFEEVKRRQTQVLGLLYGAANIKEQYIDVLWNYAPKGRPNPLAGIRESHVEDSANSANNIEHLFFAIKNGELTPQNVFKEI
ncbi:FAD/NAD(P)-binding domain-containing protein [Ascoidea rubescens DSM 1968]|uniref:FAD/NAD(P)-binding domain-containing protein n=1 Tax=Ascoidea rubescens DSM 1968 TaxID=1344418 RepID=A0A1D2VGW3_9ASCO|nr:FAD/NAD(P)-binding domain-containing protein [Ascoidea rubescens DSM 1968]ODV60839.1 FAD/NAD(P)-binding domain-containing protein [Ascoidea rubescens DSM 1968]